METILDDKEARTATPLEDFLRTYLETIGGDWDEVEPQVYDVLVPSGNSGTIFDSAGGVPRLTFDPEALPEHPGAQLASFGAPLIDALLADAIRRGRSAVLHLVGLNLSPHDLAGRARRAIKLPAPLSLQVDRLRPLLFPQALFWFQAEFTSDQKEQVIIPVAMDLHYAREVRRLDLLLEPDRLADAPAMPLPEVRRSSLAAVYPAARAQVLRSVSTLANARGRELHERCAHQVKRMRQYYADLRQELDAPSRSKQAEDADDRRAGRKQSIDREEQVRIAELQQKSLLQVRLRLLQVLVIQQPKLLVKACLVGDKHPPVLFDLVWDPVIETLEPPPCPTCHRPGYAFHLHRLGQIRCKGCPG